MGKELSERKKRILHALVDLYISTGQPVSSSDIQSKYLPEVSSATVRSELSALEALGYIAQPHTSAGRIPLKDAYKFYVESISAGDSSSMLTDQETAFIRNRFVNRLNEIEDLSKEAAKIISDITNYTSFAVETNVSNIEIEEIKLVPIKGSKAVVLIVTNRGMIANKAIDLKSDGLDGSYLDTATRVLNRVFQGRNIKDIEAFELGEIDEEIKGFRDIFDEVLDILRIYVSEHRDNVFVEGALKMLDYPEYNNVEDAKNFLSVISDRRNMSELLPDDGSLEFSVRIGKEDSGVDKCAIITAAYKVGDEIMGQAGVIGPQRMDYKKVIGVLDYIKKTMSTVINPIGDDEQ